MWMSTAVKETSLAYSNRVKILRRREPKRNIHLGDKKYIMIWTSTARKRAENTNKSSTVIYGTYLKNVLQQITKNTSWLNQYSGYITIRDFKTGLFSVINIENEAKKIRIVTCGKVKELYPHYNDLVIQRNRDGVLLKYNWDFKQK